MSATTTTTEKYTEVPEVPPEVYLYHEFCDLRDSLRREVESERLFRSRAARCPKRVFPFAPRSMEQAKAWLHEVRWGWSEAVPLTRSERDDVVRWIEAHIMFLKLTDGHIWDPMGGKPVDVPAGLNEFEERRFILIESYRQKAERRLERLQNPKPDPVQYPDGLPLWIAERLVPGWGDDDD